MKVLVTGSTGFLGSECVRRLRDAGHDVTGTDKREGADIALDLADTRGLDRLPSVDAVIHSAAVQYVSPDLPLIRRAAYFRRNNVEATRNLIRRYSGSGAHFVNVGTSMMYEQTGRRSYDESCPWRGQGLYTASKIEAQRMVDAMPDPTACVIPCIIAGEGRGGLFASLTGSIHRWGVAIWPGPGAHKIHLVHVRDAASLLVTVVTQRAVGRFNAASLEPLGIADWVDEIETALHLSHVRRVRVPLIAVKSAAVLSGYRLLAREQLLMLNAAHVLSIDAAAALGWAPAFTNAEIVRETARRLTASS